MFKLLTYILAISLFTGCTSNKYSQLTQNTFDNLGQIAVVPFENYSNNPNAGLIVSDQLASELMINTNLNILSPEKVRLLLAPFAGKILTAKKMANIIKSQTIITGTVTEYRYKTGVSQKPAIGMTVYMLNVATNKIIWSANCAKSNNNIFGSNSLGHLTQQQCAKIVQNLIPKTNKNNQIKKRNFKNKK